MLTATAWLQCGHDEIVVENFGFVRSIDSAVKASMRPRRDSRGEPDASLFRSVMASRLQCGHDEIVVENAEVQGADGTATQIASMRPRRDSRGERLLLYWPYRVNHS